MTFTAPGKTRAIRKALLERTDPAHWDGEAGRLFDRNDAQNLLLHLEQYRMPPAE